MKTKEQVVIELPRLNIHEIDVTLVGDSPLISHRWSEKAKKEMLDKQYEESEEGEGCRRTHTPISLSRFRTGSSDKPINASPDDIEHANFSRFPVIAFKAAAVGACSHVDGIIKFEARGAFHINGDFAVVEASSPMMREDMVRIGMGTADLRYRGEFKHWRTTLHVRYNASVLSAEQIVNLFNTAGFAIGVREWRRLKRWLNWHVSCRHQSGGGMIYKWRAEAVQHPKVDAQTVGEHLEYLRNSAGGQLTARGVLEDAAQEDRRSIPHLNGITMSRQSSSGYLRLRQLVTSIAVVIVGKKGYPPEVRAFVSIKDDGAKITQEGIYVRSVDAIQSPRRSGNS